jgi:hypothetical protein
MLRSAVFAMKLNRVFAFAVVGAALAAWFAAASTAGRRPIVASPVERTTTVEVRGAELAAEIARLRERLHPTTSPQQPTRNLFAFSRATPSRRAEIVPRPEVTEEPASSRPDAPPSLRLVGIAEDEGADGIVRTAIISSMDQLFFAKVGDEVTSRYRIAKISGEAAELTDRGDNSSITLVLK